MMGLRQYVLSVICAALICGIAQSLVRDGIGKGVIKLICSVFLMVTLLAPLPGLRLELESFLPDRLEGECLAAQGENMARGAVDQLIKEQLETYILDKAAALPAQVQAEVILNEDGLPVAALLAGRLPPEARETLEEMIQTDLGIPKENLQWTG